MRVWLIVLLFFYTGVLSAEHSIDTVLYDPNGNMKTDQYRSTVLNYDRANQPISITKYILSPSSSTTYHFGYGIADNKIFKGTMSQAYYYLGSQGIYDINADKWEHYPGGVLRLKNGETHKIVKDHLSNTRAIIGQSDACGGGLGVITAYDYYPFGKVLRKHENPVSRFQSTDHEKDLETGYDDRNARLYDDEAFRFMQTDFLSDAYPSHSPYHYCGSNPISIIDPMGMSWYETSKGSLFWDKSNVESINKCGEDFINVGEEINREKYLSDGTYYIMHGNSDGTTELNKPSVPIASVISDFCHNISSKAPDWLNSFSEKGGIANRGLSNVGDIAMSMTLVGNSVNLYTGKDFHNQDMHRGFATFNLATMGLVGEFSSIASKITQEHHLISNQIFRENREILKGMGWIQNHYKNLMTLPVPFHGNHPAYSNYVRARLEYIISKGGTLDDVVKLQNEMRTTIQGLLDDGVTNLNSYFKSLGH